MDAPMGIHWREGLFLRPHHLQQMILHVQGTSSLRVGQLRPHAWGLFSLKVDPLRLEEGVFQVAALEMVLPSGEVVKYSAEAASNAVVQSRPVPKTREPRLRVYAGVRRLRDQEANVGELRPNAAPDSPEELDPPRYFRVPLAVHDLVTGKNRVEVDHEKLNVRLFFEGERLDGFEAVPVAELVPAAVGLPLNKMSKSFVPPCLRVDACEVLHAYAKDVYVDAANKGGELGGAIDAADLMSGNATEAEFLQLWKLHTLRGVLPLLREAADGGGVHPFELYMALLAFQGQFSALMPGTRPQDFPRYEPMDAGNCFEQVTKSILGLLRSDEGPANFKRIDLRRGQLPVGGAAAAAQGIPQEWLDPRHTIYVVLTNPSGGGPDRDWWRSGHFKVGAVSRIATVVTTRQFGVQLSPCEKPRALPSRANSLYYRLETRNAARPEMKAEWDMAVRERSLAVHFATEGLGPESQGVDLDFEAYVLMGR
jgi:type VI secretion system protein ImpJ